MKDLTSLDRPDAIGSVQRSAPLPGAKLDRMLMRLLGNQRVPQSAYKLVASLDELGHRLPAASVYRGLARLLRRSAIERVETLAAYRVKDLPEAALMICGDCGQTASVPVPEHHEALRQILTEARFKVAAIAIEARGQCDACRRLTQKATR